MTRWPDSPAWGTWRSLRWPLALAGVGIVWGLLLARLALLDAALLTLVAAVTLGCIFEPLVGVAAALWVGLWWAWLRAYMPQVPALLGQYLFAIALVMWGARKLAAREWRVARPALGLLLPLLAFLGVTLLSLVQAVDAWMGLLEWLKWVQIALMALLVYDRLAAPGGDRRAAWMVAALLATGLFQAGMGLWQFALRGSGPAHFAINERFYRAYGSFEQPNPFAGFMGMMAALAVGLCGALALAAVTRRRLPGPALGATLGAAVAASGALIASWSRGAWMGFAAALPTMALLLPRRRLWSVALALALIGGGVGAYAAGWLPPSVAARLTGFLEYTRFSDVRGVGINDANYSVLERMAHWQAALEMWRDHFWLGVGFGDYEAAYPRYRLLNWPIALGHAHNYYLNLLAETGVLGLLAYLWLFGALGVGLWRASARLEGYRRGLAIGLLGAVAHLSVHSLVDNLLVNNVHLHLGVLVALAAWVLDELDMLTYNHSHQ